MLREIFLQEAKRLLEQVREEDEEAVLSVLKAYSSEE